MDLNDEIFYFEGLKWAVTDMSRQISNRWLRSLYSVKLCFKSEPFDLKSMAEIHYSVQLRDIFTTGNPGPRKVTVSKFYDVSCR